MSHSSMIVTIITLLAFICISVYIYLSVRQYNEKPKELITKNYDIEKITANIIGTNGESWTKTFVGRVAHYYPETKSGLIFCTAKTKMGIYLSEYGNTKLFEDDNGNLIPDSRISFIKIIKEKKIVEFSYYEYRHSHCPF